MFYFCESYPASSNCVTISDILHRWLEHLQELFDKGLMKLVKGLGLEYFDLSRLE